MPDHLWISFSDHLWHVFSWSSTRNRAEYCFESTVLEERTHWVLRQTRWVLPETGWVHICTQIIGWKGLTEFAPRNSVSPKKLTEFGVWNRTPRNRIRPVSDPHVARKRRTENIQPLGHVLFAWLLEDSRGTSDAIVLYMRSSKASLSPKGPNWSLMKGMRRSRSQWREASFHWMRERHSVNEGFGKDFHRKKQITEEVPATQWIDGL